MLKNNIATTPFDAWACHFSPQHYTVSGMGTRIITVLSIVLIVSSGMHPVRLVNTLLPTEVTVPKSYICFVCIVYLYILIVYLCVLAAPAVWSDPSDAVTERDGLHGNQVCNST